MSSFPNAKISKPFDPKPTTDTSGSPYTNMPVTLRSLQERNNALEGQSHGIFTKHLLIGLEIERKYDLQNESFLQGKYHLACHFIFLTACKKRRGLVCSRNECFHNRHLFLVLLRYTKLVYFTVVILDLRTNILTYLDKTIYSFLLSTSGMS